MASRASMINRPDAFEILELPVGVRKLSFEPDSRISCCGTFMIWLEDHTLGNLLRLQLLRDSNVIFAGYKIPHPLEHKMELRIQTTDSSTPQIALGEAINNLKNEVQSIAQQFSLPINN